LVAHSYGVMNMYYQLTKMNQKDKDKMIKVAVGVGGNFTGTLTADYSANMPTNDYSYGVLKFHYEGNLYGFS